MMTYEEKQRMVRDAIANWCKDSRIRFHFGNDPCMHNEIYEFEIGLLGTGSSTHKRFIFGPESIYERTGKVIAEVIGELSKIITEKKCIRSGYIDTDIAATRYVSRAVETAYKKYGSDIKDVIFNDPATIVFWKDGTKTVVKCQEGEKYDREKGLAMAIAKKKIGSNHRDYYEVFAKYIGRDDKRRRKAEEKVFNDANEMGKSLVEGLTKGIKDSLEDMF